MTAFALTHSASTGLTSIYRGTAFSFATEKMGPPLMERLLSYFSSAITFLPYQSSLDQLGDRLAAAAMDDEIQPEALARAFTAASPALEFLLARPMAVPLPDIDVWPDGRIAFEWYEGRSRVVTATIDDNRRLVFSALIGQARRGEVLFVDSEWPATLVAAIRQIRS